MPRTEREMDDREEALVRADVEQQRVLARRARQPDERRHFLTAVRVLDEVKGKVGIDTGGQREARAALNSNGDRAVRLPRPRQRQLGRRARVAETAAGKLRADRA